MTCARLYDGYLGILILGDTRVADCHCMRGMRWILYKEENAALPSPGLRGLLLELVPAIFPALVFALALLILTWKPALGAATVVLALCNCLNLLFSYFARRAL